MRIVTVEEMGNIIQQEFEDYVQNTADDVKKLVEKVANDVTEEIKKNAPVDTGKYKKSWKATKTKDGALSTEYTIHSVGHYRLTHLLEFGHALRNGGRTRAFPHISKGEALAIRELQKGVKIL